MEVFSISEVAKMYGKNYKAVATKIKRHHEDGKPMYGTRKSGGNWIVTREYMEVNYGDKQQT